jgi:hypothetical protein
MAAAVACFQNRDAALHPKALLLSEQARAQIIKKDEVGSKLPCEKDGTDFSEAQSGAAQTNLINSRGVTNFLHIDPGTHRNVPRASETGSGYNNFSVDLGGDDQLAI